MSFFNGWALAKDSRSALLELFKPKWPERVVAAHITNEFVRGDVPLHMFHPFPKSICVIGMVADERAQSLLIIVNEEFRRPDGGYYHCTWSLAPDAKPVHGGQIENPERGIVGWPLFKGCIQIEDCSPIWKGN